MTGRTASKACGGAEETDFLCERRASVFGFAGVQLKLNDPFASLLNPNYCIAHSVTRTSDSGLSTVDLHDETTQKSPRFPSSFHLSHIYHKGG
jgi:hypothetical protein